MDYTVKPYGPKRWESVDAWENGKAKAISPQNEGEPLVSDPACQYGEGHIWLICSKGTFSLAVYSCEICNWLSNEKYVPLKCPGPRIGRLHWQELVALKNAVE